MQLTKQESAFMQMITVSELSEEIVSESEHQGFDVIVGSVPGNLITFTDFSDHPRKLVYLPKLGISSTAAGAFQILARYFDAYRSQFALPDFTPMSQQRIALAMLHETGAQALINNGDIAGAIHLARSRWASFPENGDSQHQNSMEHLLAAYNAAFEADDGTDTAPTAFA